MLSYRFSCFKVDREKRVTSGTGIIHSRLADLSQTITLHHDSFDLLNALHCQDGQILHEHAFIFVLLEFKFRVGIWSKQVTDFFVVNLNV